MSLAGKSCVVTGGAAGIGAVAFLADDEQSAFVIGATLRVDGGWSAQGWIF